MSRRDVREVSAGGVVVRRRDERHDVCLVLRDRHGPPTWSLPKGHVESGETLRATALREVREETGLRGRILAPLQTIRYRFTLKGDPVAHAKTVRFFLIRAQGRRLGRRGTEVRQARWMPFGEALRRVRYENERRVLRAAARYLEKQLSADE